MSIFDAIATPRKVQGTVYIEPLAKAHVCVFEGVKPYDVLTLPGQFGCVTDVKVFGDKRRLGPKRCRVDALACVVQVIRPPKSGCVTVRWFEHAPLRSLGSAIVSMTTTTTYGDRHDG